MTPTVPVTSCCYLHKKMLRERERGVRWKEGHRVLCTHKSSSRTRSSIVPLPLFVAKQIQSALRITDTKRWEGITSSCRLWIASAWAEKRRREEEQVPSGFRFRILTPCLMGLSVCSLLWGFIYVSSWMMMTISLSSHLYGFRTRSLTPTIRPLFISVQIGRVSSLFWPREM